MRTAPSRTPTPETVDNHRAYGRLKLQAGVGITLAVAFFGSAYANEGWNLLQLMGGTASTFLAAARNSAANHLSDTIEQQMLTSYTQTHFKSGAKSEDPRHHLSAEGRELRDITPKEEPAPA